MTWRWIDGPSGGYYWDDEQWKIDPVKDAESRARAERLRTEIDAAIAARAKKAAR